MSSKSHFLPVPEPLRTDSRRGWKSRARWYEAAAYRVLHWAQYRGEWALERQLRSLIHLLGVLRHGCWKLQQRIIARPQAAILGDLRAWRAQYDEEHPEAAA